MPLHPTIPPLFHTKKVHRLIQIQSPIDCLPKHYLRSKDRLKSSQFSQDLFFSDVAFWFSLPFMEKLNNRIRWTHPKHVFPPSRPPYIRFFPHRVSLFRPGFPRSPAGALQGSRRGQAQRPTVATATRQHMQIFCGLLGRPLAKAIRGRAERGAPPPPRALVLGWLCPLARAVLKGHGKPLMT